ncbi:MAG: LysR family transcriptional regulator [Hyphomicrobiales bacterium]|nr:LysR family transcriptional regulator [Hyphomicrobiales bacterium]
MDRLRLMASFAAVVRTRSFTAAAKQLGSSRSLITRHVTQLEQHLGTRLLNRTTQQLSVTASGEHYYAFCVRMLSELQKEESALAGLRTQPKGTLRVLAPKHFGFAYLSHAIAAFVKRYPEINISLILDDQAPDLGRFTNEAFDIAIRTAPARDSTLITRKIAQLRWVVCGTPRFFQRNKRPRQPSDLPELPCLHYGFDKHELVFHGPDGFQRIVINGPIKANSVSVLRTAALADVGLLIAPIYAVNDDLRAGRLIEVLDAYSLEPNVLTMVYARDKYQPARLTRFIDFLMEWYAQPSWDAPVDASKRVLRNSV